MEYSVQYEYSTECKHLSSNDCRERTLRAVHIGTIFGWFGWLVSFRVPGWFLVGQVGVAKFNGAGSQITPYQRLCFTVNIHIHNLL